MRKLFAIGLLAAVPLTACLSPNRSLELPTSPEAAIPIRRVVLYQNGIGYFERSGPVEGDVFTLQARPSQINDLLKSLTVIDSSNGRAVSVSLPLEPSGDRVLAELPEQVRNAAGILDVLRVFRGARVEIKGDNGSYTGRVVGVENVETQEGEKVAADWRVTLKTLSGELVLYPLKAISKILIQDPTLEIGLEQSLDVSLKEGTWKPVTLAIRLAGEQTHQLRASYIVEMPRWKPAYRIVLDARAPLLQGWAVVDNVSGEDWRDVELSLVTGTPMSFVYDLHSPQFSERPDLTPRHVQAALTPPPEETGREEELADEDMGAAGPAAEASAPGGSVKDRLQRGYGQAAKKASGAGNWGQGAAPSAAPAPPPPPVVRWAPPKRDASLDTELEKQVSAQVAATQVGALFRYALKDRVTVPDRSSTLVAIVNQRVNAEEVAYFRPELSDGSTATHPYRAIKLSNNTGLHLEKGPATIYAQGTFVGEGFLEQLGNGQTTFLTYAIDSNVSMDSRAGAQDEGLKLLKIINGQLVAEVLHIESTSYTLRNDYKKPIKAYIKTAKKPDWKLLDQPVGSVDMSDSFVVPVMVPARGKAEIAVRWQKRIEQFVGIGSDLSANLLRVYVQGGKAPPEIAKVLERILELKAKLSADERETTRLNDMHSHLSADVQRLRDNLNVLRKTQGNRELETKLARKLSSLEEELGKISGQLVRLSEERADIENQMNQLIRGITLTSIP